MNRMTNMTDGIGTSAFAYTQAGQLASETGPWASNTIAYSYSQERRTALNLQQPGGTNWAQSYGYDLAARLDAVTSPVGTFSYSYDHGLGGVATSSRLIDKLALPTGAFITNTFDSNGRMTGTYLYNPSLTDLDSMVYTNNVGNQRIAAVRNSENYATYTYDPSGQLTSDLAFESADGTRYNEQLRYTFDHGGNLAYRTNNNLVENFMVNSLNELTTNTNGGTLTAMGSTTTTLATNVTVNGTNALLYGDATFAATNMPLTTTYTAVAKDSYGRVNTNVA